MPRNEATSELIREAYEVFGDRPRTVTIEEQDAALLVEATEMMCDLDSNTNPFDHYARGMVRDAIARVRAALARKTMGDTDDAPPTKPEPPPPPPKPPTTKWKR